MFLRTYDCGRRRPRRERRDWVHDVAVVRVRLTLGQADLIKLDGGGHAGEALQELCCANSGKGCALLETLIPKSDDGVGTACRGVTKS